MHRQLLERHEELIERLQSAATRIAVSSVDSRSSMANNAPAVVSLNQSQMPHSPMHQDDCCSIIKFWKLWQIDEANTPRQHRQMIDEDDRYQAPPLTSPIPLRMQDEDDTEEHRLLTGLPSTTGTQAVLNPAAGHHDVVGPLGGPPLASINQSTDQTHKDKTKGHHRRASSGAESLKQISSQSAVGRHRKGPSFTGADLPPKMANDNLSAQVSVSPDDDDADYCPTCLEAYTPENPKTFTACGHHYHLPCLYEWSERKDTCPICDSPLRFPGM